MLRVVLVSASLLLLPVGDFTAPAAAAAPQTGKKCDQSSSAKQRRSMMGGLLGGIARNALGRVGAPSSVAGVSIPVSSMLSEAIMDLLDCKEQQQAANATNEAVRGGVGTTATWTSESRPNVSGSSSVTAEQKLADGGSCLTVTDVVIIDGEETTVPKRMCRAPGASGYARV